jgi:hypothetical protein
MSNYQANVAPLTDAQASDAVPAVVSPDQKLIMRGRVKSAAELATVFTCLFNEDLLASQKRAMVQASIGGDAPKDQANLVRKGLGGSANINWGSLGQAVEEAQTPYWRLLEALDVFVSTPLQQNFLDVKMRSVIEPILASCFTRMLMKWPSFRPRWSQLVNLYVSEGVAMTLHDDPYSWKWMVRGLSDLKFPRSTPADVEYLDVIVCEDYLRPDELMSKVRSEDEGEEAYNEVFSPALEVEAEEVIEKPETGEFSEVEMTEDDIIVEDKPVAVQSPGKGYKRYWNKSAILEAIRETSGSSGLDTNDPEAIARAWKGNDISYGITANTVRVIHGYIKELDGTVSHYVCRFDGQGDFLYKCEGKFSDISELLTAFTEGVGTTGNFHSIRGLGYKLFSPTTGSNKLINKMLDNAMFAATPHLSTSNEDFNVEKMMVPIGPYMMLAEGLNFQANQNQDVNESIVPAIQTINGILQARASASAPVLASQTDRTRKTATQVDAEVEMQGSMQSSSFSLFMASWEKLLVNTFRRVCRPDYLVTDPGGPEVHKFYNRLLIQLQPLGVTSTDQVIEILQNVDFDAMEVNSGIGKGSASERRSVVTALNQSLGGQLDPEGQRFLNRLTAASYAGFQIANQLVPDEPGLRPPMDAQVAQMENSLMSLGQPPAFEPNQDHFVHLEKHTEFLNTVNEGFGEQIKALKPGTDGGDLLRETIDKMEPVWLHCNEEHMPMLSDMNPAKPMFKENLQQLGEFIKNSRKHLDAEAQRELEASGQAEGDLYGGVPAGLVIANADAAARAATAKEQATTAKTLAEAEAIRTRTYLEAAQARQNMAVKDVETSLKVKEANKPEPPKAKK